MCESGVQSCVQCTLVKIPVHLCHQQVLAEYETAWIFTKFMHMYGVHFSPTICKLLAKEEHTLRFVFQKFFVQQT